MNLGKEVDAKSAAHIFRAVAQLLDSVAIYYEAGQPEKGEVTFAAVAALLDSLPDDLVR